MYVHSGENIGRHGRDMIVIIISVVRNLDVLLRFDVDVVQQPFECFLLTSMRTEIVTKAALLGYGVNLMAALVSGLGHVFRCRHQKGLLATVV